jgi:hypothetical protein
MQAGGAPAAGDAPAAAAHAQASCVYIKRAGDAPADGDVFAELLILPGDTVARLAERACAKFAWGTPSQARLLLVDHPHDADEPPSAEQETVATELTRPHWALPRAGVRSGSWLLARVPPPPPPAGASCVGPPTAPYSPLVIAGWQTLMCTRPVHRRAPASAFAHRPAASPTLLFHVAQ